MSGDMAQLLQHNQEKYVPVMVNEQDSTSTVLAFHCTETSSLRSEHVMSSGHSGMVWIQLKELMGLACIHFTRYNVRLT